MHRVNTSHMNLKEHSWRNITHIWGGPRPQSTVRSAASEIASYPFFLHLHALFHPELIRRSVSHLLMGGKQSGSRADAVWTICGCIDQMSEV